jgi:D-alanine-D-alanine ligase
VRLCLLCSEIEPSSPFAGVDSLPDPSAILPEHAWQRHTIPKRGAVEAVRRIAHEGGFDAFVNLCDGAADEDVAGVEVARELERLGVAYTGARPSFYEPTREAIKDVCARSGIDAPRGLTARTLQDAQRAAASLRFPLFVKHPNSYGSIGLDPGSRVHTPEALFARVERMHEAFGGALVEEFVDGPEFTVLVAEPPSGGDAPIVYTPLQIRFPPGETFKHFDVKWVDWRDMEARPVADAALADRLRGVGEAFFRAFPGSGYARCDIRMDGEGRLFLLDVNPNCGVFYREGEYGMSDQCLAHSPGGRRGFLEHILDCALGRRR